MRRVAILLIIVFGGFAIGDCNSAEAGSGKIRIAQTGTVTNCMMACNSQAATCRTTCLVPGTAPTSAATTTGNANQNTACQANCSTQQINCQTTCAATSPSQ